MVAPMTALWGTGSLAAGESSESKPDNLMALPVEGGWMSRGSIERFCTVIMNFATPSFVTAKTMAPHRCELNSFHQSRGKIAVLGRIGAGKSTLLQAMMGNVELTSGELRLDDLSLPQIDLADIRRNATLLTQEARLFHGTLRENVTRRPMASDDELVKVLELCGALEFVNKLPMGLEHLVMEGGLGLSGGSGSHCCWLERSSAIPILFCWMNPPHSFDERTEKRLSSSWPVGQENVLIIATHKAAVLNIVDRILVIQDGSWRWISLKRRYLSKKSACSGGEHMNKPTAAIFPLVKELDPVAAMADNERDEAELVKSRRLIALLALLLVVTGVWAWFATLDEVSTGTGKVIPSSREQVLQTLDGGILTELNVREGSRVAAGVVARLIRPAVNPMLAKVRQNIARH